MALWGVFRREIRRLKAMRMSRWMLFWGPLTAIGTLVAILWQGTPSELPIALCDLDHTPLSRRLTEMVEASPSLRVAAPIQTPIQGEELLHKGEVWAVVVIPEGFERKVLRMQSAPVESFVVGSNLTANGLVRRELRRITTTLSTGIAIGRFVGEGMTPSEARSTAMPIRMRCHTLFNPTLDYTSYLAPGFLMLMLVVFLLQATIYTFGMELKRGSGATLRFAAQGNPWAIALGKLLPLTLVYTAWGQLILLTLLLLGVPLRGSLLLLEPGVLLLIAAYESLGVLIVALTGNLRLSLSLGGGYAVMAFSFSGLTFPVEAMWRIAGALSPLFPFSPFSQLLMDQLLRGAIGPKTLWQLLHLGLFVLALPWAVHRYRTALENPDFRNRR